MIIVGAGHFGTGGSFFCSGSSQVRARFAEEIVWCVEGLIFLAKADTATHRLQWHVRPTFPRTGCTATITRVWPGAQSLASYAKYFSRF
jgi:hypothetical protein